MREERRVCVVLCKQKGPGYRFGVLRRSKGWDGWELIKGHIEEEDDAEQAAVREVVEEAGISEDRIRRVKPLDYSMEWTYEDDGESVKSVCDCFLVVVPEDVFISVDQNPHDEHETGHFLNFRDARDILTYENQKALLQHVKNNHLR